MGGAHLAQVVKVVLVMDPAVVGGHAVRTVGDVAGVHTQTVVELALEELWGGTRGERPSLATLPGVGMGVGANQKRDCSSGDTSSVHSPGQALNTIDHVPPRKWHCSHPISQMRKLRPGVAGNFLKVT